MLVVMVPLDVEVFSCKINTKISCVDGKILSVTINSVSGPVQVYKDCG